MAELGFINVPIAPSFIGIAGQLNDKLIKPARDAGKKAASEVEKSVNDSVKSLERQVAASTKKLNDFDRAREDSTGKRKVQQDRLNAAIAEQAAAEEKYQAALKKGESGLAEQAKVEKARAKVTDETIKLTKAERDITDAEQKHKSQLEDLQRTTEKYQKAQLDLNNEVSKSKGTFGGLKDSFGGLKNQVSEMGGSMGGLGETMANFKNAPKAGWAAIAAAVVAAGTAYVQFNNELEKSRISMQNQFGLSADAARNMQGEIADALGSGMGGYEETALAVTQISQVLGDEVAHMGGQTAAQLSDDFMAFNQTFQRSAEETASTVDVMLNSGMVSNAQEGLDLLTAGMQKVPAAMQDEVFDAMNEYSKHFNTLGIDGADAMAMLVAASENGQYAIDKTGDAIKEFSLRGSDMSKTSTEAYDLIGLSAEDMASKIAAGGEGAQEALKLTAEGLLGIEDPAERANTAIALFGTPVEDLGVDQIPSFLEALTAGSEGMGDFEGAAQTMADNTGNTFSGMFASAKGKLHGWAIDATNTVNEWAGNTVGAIADSGLATAIGDTFTDIKDLGSGVWDILYEGDYTGLPFGLEEDSGVVDFLFDIREGVIGFKDDLLGAWEEISTAFSGGDWGFGALSDLIGEENAQAVIDFIADLGEKLRDFKDDATEYFQSIWEVIEPIFSWLGDFFNDQMAGTLDSLWESLKSIGDAFWSIAEAVGGALIDTLKGFWDILVALWNFISPVLVPLLTVLGGIIGGVLVVAFMALVGAVRLVSEVIEFAANIIQWVAENILAPLIGLVGNVASVFADVLVGAIVSLHTYFSDIFGAISLIWDGFTDLLGIGKDFIVGVVFGGLQGGLDAVKGSFQTAVDAIGKIWDGLKELAAAPIRFIVNTVWNNGLLKAIGAVAKFTGMDAPEPIQIGFARGGILPGFSRMTDGDDQLVPMRQGEGVLVSEALKDQHSRDLFLSANEAGKKGKTFAGFMRDYVAGYADGGIVGSLNSIMRQFYPGLSLTSHYRPGDSGYHGKNMAADFSNTGDGMPSNPEMQAAAAFMFGNYGDQLEQLIHNPARNIGSGMDVGDGFGYYGADTMNDHTDHIHLAALQPLVDPSGVVQMVPFDGESGGGFSIMGQVKKLWDAVVNKINPFPDDGSWFAQMPSNFRKSAGDMLWELVSGKVGSGSYDGAGGISGNVESWREMVMDAMRRNGFDADNPAQVNAMLKQIQSESSGIPNRNQEIVDVNGTGASAAQGLLQIIPGTFAAHRDPSLPDDRTDAWANMNAALRYYRATYGGDLTTMWGQGHGYAQGGIVDMAKMLGAVKYDVGGIMPDGTIAINQSGEDEFILKHSGMRSLGDLAREVGDLVPAIKDQTEVVGAFADSASEWVGKALDRDSVEGATARGAARRVLDLGLDLPGTDVLSGVLDAEESIWASRERGAAHLKTLAEKEKALVEAREALAKLESAETTLSVADQRKLDDATAAVEEAKADAAQADSDSKRASAADKLADAEQKLSRVREDLDANATESAEKHSEEITKANEQVTKAESDLVEAKKAQVADLDHLIVLSRESIDGMGAQVDGFAQQLIGMGAPADMVNQGLAGVVGVLSQVAGAAGPAGLTLGGALDLVKTAIDFIDIIKNFLDEIWSWQQSARQAVADAWQVVADYAALLTEMQHNVSVLQQDIIRGLQDQRAAEFELRVATHDRLVAEAEGALAVAEARKALDDEIAKGNIAAQLKLMGLYEDWDSYNTYAALAAGGMLEAWSDSAISGLFTYEAARAQAVKSELEARLKQIYAETALAKITVQNARNQSDLLKAQERLIKMSAEANGVDLVDATASAQMAQLMVESAELQKSNDSNVAGKITQGADFLFGWVPGVDISSPWSKEMEGNQQRIDANRKLIKQIGEEYGVEITDSQINAAMSDMAAVAATGGDPSSVLRKYFPEFAAAEDAKRKEQAYSPIWDAEDQQASNERDIDDLIAAIEEYEKTQPLSEEIQGLEYTIASLDSAAAAWADDNEDVRADYLGVSWANYLAAKDLGVDWQLDPAYATSGVRDQIAKEITINLNGAEMYTADQVDELLSEVTSGSNVNVTTNISASTLATSRRGVNA